jgi:hypothetical protein
MISEKIVLLVAALIAFPLTANAAPTNLISNGSFEKLSGSPTAEARGVEGRTASEE